MVFRKIIIRYLIKRYRSLLKNIKLFNFKNNKFDVAGKLLIDKSSKIQNTKFIVRSEGTIIVKKNVSINNYFIRIDKGIVIIENNTILTKGILSINRPMLNCINGELIIGHHNVIKSDFLIKFGGSCKIGIYNAINENTELRCDESITIGDFNMISYNCNLYDTNTHNIYEPEKRRKMTVLNFPFIGEEFERPKTKPLIIGSDCWVGKGASILKGVSIGNHAIVASSAVITKSVPSNHISFGNPSINKKINNF